MSRIRSITLATLAILTVAAVALATFPANAEQEAGLLVSATVDETLPRVSGTVVVTDADGVPVTAALVKVTSTLDAAPDAPAARSAGGTDADGVFAFAFGYASTGSLPGDHTLTVVVTYDGVEETIQVAYSVPEL